MRCGLLPWDVERMTPAEINAHATATERREQRHLERTGWHVCHLLNALGGIFGSKDPIQLADLLPHLTLDQPAAPSRQAESVPVTDVMDRLAAIAAAQGAIW